MGPGLTADVGRVLEHLVRCWLEVTVHVWLCFYCAYMRRLFLYFHTKTESGRVGSGLGFPANGSSSLASCVPTQA